MGWYLAVLKKYAVFSGRARRMEYWMFNLISFLIVLGLELIDVAIGTGGIFSMIYALGVALPSLAVFVRRLHDIGRSGWWLLIALVPLLGALVLLYWTFKDGEYRTNEYGPNPKTAAMEAQTA
ncbi:MAG: DUF805 domain-containing protein [Desulfobacterales bacterium]|nr:DUF805 domain-containing protein [Desulfobacterales bacterium]